MYIAKCLFLLLLGTNFLFGQQRKKIVLCSFYPIYILTKNIAAEVSDVQIENMTKAEVGCLHDYQLTPQDMKKLTSAHTLVVNGGGMEQFLTKAVQQVPQLRIIDASKNISFLASEEAHDHKGHNHHTETEFNAHIWLSVSGAIAQVKNIRDGLIAVDSANVEKYKLNANKYLERLDTLKNKMHAGLANIQNRNIVTFHEAFDYFANEFNLNVVAVVEQTPGVEPNAREIVETIKKIKAKNVKAIFVEPQYSFKVAEMISRETGVKLYTLDPIVNGPDDPDAYIKIMEKNLSVLQEALR